MCIYAHPFSIRVYRVVKGEVISISAWALDVARSTVMGIPEPLRVGRVTTVSRLNRNCDYKYLNYRVYNLTYHINDTKIFPLKTYAYYNFIHCKQFGIPLYFK